MSAVAIPDGAELRRVLPENKFAEGNELVAADLDSARFKT